MMDATAYLHRSLEQRMSALCDNFEQVIAIDRGPSMYADGITWGLKLAVQSIREELHRYEQDCEIAGAKL